MGSEFRALMLRVVMVSTVVTPGQDKGRTVEQESALAPEPSITPLQETQTERTCVSPGLSTSLITQHAPLNTASVLILSVVSFARTWIEAGRDWV